MKHLLIISALLCTVAQGAWATDYSVKNETELRGAIENGANITLTQDITIGSAITFNDGITVTINLGGHTLNRNSTSDNRSQVIGVYSSSTLNISNGTLTGGWGGDGGILNQATLNMTNVTISGNKGNDRGGGISNNGTLTMTDCTVSNNTSLDATDPAGGGGIFNYNGKEATLTNCTITGNTASTYAGGGICNYGTLNLTNCSVKNNSANTTGGGIFCSTSGTLSINGCDITGNSAVSYGDGIYIDNSTLNMQGLCTVKDNTDSNIYLYGSGTKITVTGAFESGSNIGVGVTDYNRKLTSGYSTYNSGTDPGNFFSSDNYKYGIGEKDGEAYAGVSYVERSWDGGDTDGHVVKTTKVCTDYTTYSSNTNDNSLGGGWYLLSGTFTFNNRVTIDGDVKFILQDGCNVEFDKGIYIPDGKTLTIYGQNGDSGYLWTDGSDGENGSIGGNEDKCGGHLVIHGGKIYAKPGSSNSAGIGGGDGSSSGMQSITIYGGNITAEGKSSGAGIGGGQQNDTHPTLKIYGGTVTATGGTFAAGIGGGEDRGNGPIYIYGGTVTATGGSSVSSNPFESGCGGAGIGGGEYGDQDNPIYIYGGTVTATGNGGNFGSAGSAGIGGGGEGDGGELYIYGGTVTATGYVFGAGIGGGYKGKGGTVYIAGGTVSATGSTFAAGIGGGYDGGSGTVTIDGGDVTVKGGEYGAGIGGSYAEDGGTITINGGTVTANGGSMGAGIGGGNKGYGGTITINGGTVTATSEEDGAGIGGGRVGEGGTITINGGTVTAYIGGYGGAGIGGGELSNGGTITINGGDVTATGGTEGGAGIGGGYGGCYGNGADVYIYGGKVTVEANGGGQAIGRGKESSVSEGTLTLGTTLSVKSGGSPVNSDSRVSTVRGQGPSILEQCDHGSITGYTDKNDYYHHINCSYCEGEDEHHIKGDNDKCTKCGHALPTHAYTLYEAKADGSGYASEGTPYYVTATHEFTFPSCSVVPKKMAFAGWLLSDTEPSGILAQDSEDLIQADSTITVPMEEADRTYYARFKNTYFSGGDGSMSNPFRINDEEDWNHLAQAVNDGINFNGMYFVMTNDINVTTMAGQGSNRFRGNFDGQGNTITVSYTGITEDYCAPFRCISGATIKNLNTTGTIETSGRYAAGVVAYTRYYSKIENCHSSVTIRSSHAGWAGHGGILGLKANVTQSEPTIEGCVFNGKILTTGTTEETKTTGAAGIVGYTNYQTLTIKNCLYKPAALAGGETAVTDGSATLYINASGNAATNVTCTDCYYTATLGTAQGTQGYTVTSGTDGLTLDFGDATKTYAYDGVKVYGFGLSYGGTLFSGSGQSVTFTPEADKKIKVVQANGSPLTGNGNGTYTVTMPAENVSITATLGNFAVALYDGQNNSTTIAANDDHIADVTLYDRTLYKDNSWNTLCLPFDVTAAQIAIDDHPLHDATIMELDTETEYSGHKTGFDASDGTLYLYFKTATEIEAGVPYIVKWGTTGSDIVNPEFKYSEIERSAPEAVKSADGKVSFKGIYDPEDINGSSYLYLGKGDKLYWPSSPRTINAFRAYFQLNGIEAGEVAHARMFFGDEETTGIISNKDYKDYKDKAGAGWYDLQGCKLSGKPTQKGVYIYNGKKRVIK